MAERPAMKKHYRLASRRVDILHVEIYPRLYCYVVSHRQCLRESKSYPDMIRAQRPNVNARAEARRSRFVDSID